MFKQTLYAVRVIDMAPGWGAYAARILGDLGAEVIKAEPPPGDPLRSSPDFARLNVNKYGCTLGGDIVERLALVSDIVIAPPEVCDMAALRAARPSLITVALPGDAGASQCLAAAAAVGIALWDRRRTGEGCHIDILPAAPGALPATGAEPQREPVSTLDGQMLVESLPWRMSESPAHIRLPAPAPGEHDAYVLGDLLA